jgi:serine/threonine protein kinase
MRCPCCAYDGTLLNGTCARCGYQVAPAPSGKLPNQYTLMRGDTLSEGRYRILHQITLPETQWRQGRAWSAVDLHAMHRRVTLYEVVVPPEMAATASVNTIVSAVAQPLQDLGQYPGFPRVTDLFSDKGTHFIVLLSPEGESLADLLKRQGGALPEPLVAEYGYQLCRLLALLADQQPPLVHGSISPETIIISEEGQQVSLIHLPLFQSALSITGAQRIVSRYYGPEQVHGEIDLSSDLYAVAAVMHHAVTGHDSYTRSSFVHTPARRLNPDVTAQMEMILARQLSLSRSRRYGHPSEMQQDLAALIASYPARSGDASAALVSAQSHLSAEQLNERSRSNALLNMGVVAAIGLFLIVSVLFVVLRP